MTSISTLESAVANRHRSLEEHAVFKSINNREDLRTFMQWHVFAVWDFMSLVKRLQQDLAGISVPWCAPPRRTAARFINEIVLGEESDETPRGHMSHFDLYRLAMLEVGAAIGQIDEFVALVRADVPVADSLLAVHAPEPVRIFVCSTMDVCKGGQTHEVLGDFFFGREDLIPDMFRKLLAQWQIEPQSVPLLSYYLNRHIELDAGAHGPAARSMIHDLTAGNCVYARQALRAGLEAIERRIGLWNGLQAALTGRRARACP
jgi:hypothetical protein